MIKHINEVEKRMIRNYTKEYAPINYLEESLFDRRYQLDKVLKEWGAAKEKSVFNTAFKDSLILERNLSTERDFTDDERNQIFDREFSDDMQSFIISFRYALNRIALKMVKEEEKEFFNLLEYELTLKRSRVLVRNIFEWKESSRQLSFANPYTGKQVKFQSGMKISKVISKLGKEFPEEMERINYSKFLSDYSIFISKLKTSATFCLSIHPLDFMTSSDNANNWTSCMRWRGAGAYRAGTVEIMNSPYVIIAYLKGGEKMDIGDDKWNSKIWRTYFIVTDQYITSVKSYPFKSLKYTKIFAEWIKELIESTTTIKYSNFEEWNYYEDDPSPLKNSDNTHIAFTFETYGNMYNDLAHDGSNILTAVRTDVKVPAFIITDFTGKMGCMCCGEPEFEAFDPEDEDYWEMVRTKALLCNECNPITYCGGACHRRLTPQTGVRRVYGGKLCCDRCYDDLAVTEIISGERGIHDDLTQIFIAANSKDELNETFGCGNNTYIPSRQLPWKEFYVVDDFEKARPYIDPKNIEVLFERVLKNPTDPNKKSYYDKGENQVVIWVEEINLDSPFFEEKFSPKRMVKISREAIIESIEKYNSINPVVYYNDKNFTRTLISVGRNFREISEETMRSMTANLRGIYNG